MVMVVMVMVLQVKELIARVPVDFPDSSKLPLIRLRVSRRVHILRVARTYYFPWVVYNLLQPCACYCMPLGVFQFILSMVIDTTTNIIFHDKFLMRYARVYNTLCTLDVWNDVNISAKLHKMVAPMEHRVNGLLLLRNDKQLYTSKHHIYSIAS